MKLTVVIERGEDGWWIATIAEIPGAFSQGKTQEEAKLNAVEAAQELMAARRELALEARSDGILVQPITVPA